MMDILKEYLVSLGFKVDNPSLDATRRAMGSAESSVSKFSSTSLTSFAKAGAAVVTFVAVANVAIGKFIAELGKADLQNEMFARKMWMSEDAARAYRSSIDALGVSLQDLYLSPELLERYTELRKEATEIAVPTKEYDQQMKAVRDVTFQFQRLKLEGTYALQWIGYYLTKYLAGPMEDVREWLQNINDMAQDKMPEWTSKIAMVASWFGRLGAAAWSVKEAIGAIILGFAAFKMIHLLSNPFGLMVLGLTALLLLIDDFNTWKDGGESAFPKVWEWVDKLGKTLDENGLNIDTFKGKIIEIIDSVDGLKTAFSELFELLSPEGGFGEVLESGIIATLMVLKDTLTSITGLLTMIDGIATADYGELGKGWDKFLEGLPKGFYENGKGIIDAFKGDKTQTSSMTKYLYPQSTTQSTTQVTLKPTYHIYGATQPNAVATTVNRSNKDMITRAFQGVVR